jgi:hypothetical protein
MDHALFRRRGDSDAAPHSGQESIACPPHELLVTGQLPPERCIFQSGARDDRRTERCDGHIGPLVSRACHRPGRRMLQLPRNEVLIGRQARYLRSMLGDRHDILPADVPQGEFPVESHHLPQANGDPIQE